MDNNRPLPVNTAIPGQPGKAVIPIVIAGVSGLLAMGLVASILFAPQGAAPVATVAMRVGAMPPDFSLTNMRGELVTLSSYRGVKPVWINFWATWCGYCKTEMPEMQQLYSAYQARGLEILGVDDQEQADQVGHYLQGKDYGWNFVLDVDGDVSRRYQVSGLPTHVFVGRDGLIHGMVTGGITRPQMEAELAHLFN